LLEGIMPAAQKLAPYSPANLIPGFREANAASLARLQQRTAQREQTQTPGKLGEFAGNVVSTGWIPGGPIINGAVTGALLSKKTDPMGMAGDAAFGAIGGKLGAGAVGLAGKALSGVTDPAVRYLAGKGIPLTVGQMAGGVTRGVEDRLAGLPIVGDMIRNAQRRGLQSVNRAAYDDTLAQIGEKLPQGVDIGRDAYNFTRQRLSDAYDEVLAPLTVAKDTGWTTDLGAAKHAISKIGDAKIKADVNQILKTEVLSRFSKSGQMTGEDLKAAQEALGQHANDLSKGTKWSRDAASAVKGVKTALEGLVARTDPDAGARLASVNKAYSLLKPLETAAAKTTSKDGIFTMAGLNQGVAKGKSAATLAGGRAPHQELADAAGQVLPSTVPDSGTAGRLLTGAALTALFGGHLPVVGPMAIPAAGLIGGMASLYTRGGQKALAAALTRRPEAARVLGKQVRRLAAPVGTAGAVAMTGARQ
jgi:hypothetical protein